jgi:AraC-like DNA-binding protein
MARSRNPTCSALLVRPFVKLLRTYETIPSAFIDAIESDSDARLSVAAGLLQMEEAVRLTGDPDLGLRASLFTELGDFEVLEWVAMSAATWREANETVCRYAGVLNEAADYRIDVVGDKAHLMLGSSLPLPRVAADYQLASYHIALRLRVPEVPAELEVWMKHAAPPDLAAYRAIFPDAKLVFRAAFDGFVTDAWRLDTPLPTADAGLHAVLRSHADQLLEKLSGDDGLVQRVSADIVVHMRSGHAGAVRSAARLGMSRRTLTRQLAVRGTSYSELLKEARYRTAMHYLKNSRHSVEDIAFLLGFSECAPFVRAFKRWSGQAPLEYRKAPS